jgi:predicted anti-sigma-YlaC factor YlaD
MMECATCREVLSADLDGEASAAERAIALDHCVTCAACAAFGRAIGRLAGFDAGDEQVPDVAPAILASAAPPVGDHDDEVLIWRLGLAFVAVAQILAATVHLGGAHAARDQAAWEAALAVGFAWAAWRPSRSTGLLPLASVLSVLLLVNGGLAAGPGGVHHLLAPVGTVFLFLATGAGHRRRPVAA